MAQTSSNLDSAQAPRMSSLFYFSETTWCQIVERYSLSSLEWPAQTQGDMRISWGPQHSALRAEGYTAPFLNLGLEIVGPCPLTFSGGILDSCGRLACSRKACLL